MISEFAKFPDAVLAQHMAILGKTGSGKTSTEKLAVEQVVDQGHRVCILDTIKSDWWGITSSASGKSAGLPFKILGGPRGHVPLHSSAGKAIGQLVGSGKLPLSIIDVADFEAGGLQRFFIDFAPALLRAARGVVYLVIEEAHEVAPKERAGIGDENLAIHWAKKLATAGRSKGIRLIVATQRTQALHNAVLGSCETLIAHRLTAPADQEQVVRWLKANVDKETQAKVAASLSSQPTGTGWICSGEAQITEQVHFRKFRTFDNNATPTGDGNEIDVKTAAVDQDELRAIIGDAVKDAEANDPRVLRKRIAELETAAKTPAATVTVERVIEKIVADPKAVAIADKAGYARGYARGRLDGFELAANLIDRHPAGSLITAIADTRGKLEADDKAAQEKHAQASSQPPAPAALPLPNRRPSPAAALSPAPAAAMDAGLTGPQAQLLRALAWWKRNGHDRPSRAQVAGIAGWKITSGHLKNVVGALRTAQLVDYPDAGHVMLTEAGAAVAPDPDLSLTLHDGVRAVLSGPQRQIFDALHAAGGQMTREEAATACGWAPTSGHLKNVVGSMRTLEIIEYPTPGTIALQEWIR